MTVAVSVPYYGCPDLVERAVRSILNQTHRDLVCIVVGDGEDPPLRNVKDSRLIVYRLPENRGPYFAQSVVVGASPHEWYAPHGADDYSDPEHIERLLAVGATAVAPNVIWNHLLNGNFGEHSGLYEVGIFTTQRLREIGGYNPAERIGQDTLTMRILRQTGGLGQGTTATYHRIRRSGSLTTSPATGFGSVARNEMRARNREVMRFVLRHPRRLDKIRAFRALRIPAQITYELNEQIFGLSELL